MLNVCVCSLKNNFFLFGNFDHNNLVYDPFKDSWKKISSMKVKWYWSFCTAFKGQCVVLEGERGLNKIFKIVESYDYYFDMWSFLPDMQTARSKAGVVKKGNQLFVICEIDLECYSLKFCEVCDSKSQKFTFIESNSNIRIKIILRSLYWQQYYLQVMVITTVFLI